MEGAVIGIVVAVFASTGFWQVILYLIQQRSTKRSALDSALMFLLRQDLIARCDYWLDRDHIPIGEWTSIVEENKLYHALGGNGDLKERMESLEEKHKSSK